MLSYTSLSPNQRVAILLAALIKKGYPIAIITDAVNTIPNSPLTWTTYLSQAPEIVHTAPASNYITGKKFLSYTSSHSPDI